MILTALLFSLNVNSVSLSKKAEAIRCLTQCNFVAQEQFATWTVINASKDTKAWVKDVTTEPARYFYSNTSNADDWLISSPVGLEGSKKYRFKYLLNQNSFRIY